MILSPISDRIFSEIAETIFYPLFANLFKFIPAYYTVFYKSSGKYGVVYFITAYLKTTSAYCNHNPEYAV